MISPGFSSVTRRAALGGLTGVTAIAWATLRTTAATARQFGVVVPDSEPRYYERMLSGMREAAKGLGIELYIVEYSSEPLRELSLIKQLLAKGLDGYVIVALGPDDAAAAAEVTGRPISRVPIAAVDRRIPGASVTVLPDLAGAGVIQAKIAMSLAPPGTTLLYLNGPASLIEQDAARAFLKAAEEGKYKVVVVTVPTFSSTAGADATAEALQAHPDIAVIAGATDVWALAAVEVAVEMKRSVKVIGLGASADGLQAVADKKLIATVDLKPDAQGAAAVRELAMVVNKGVCDNGQNPPCPEQTIQPQPVLASKAK
jgi:ribose transport system substrate-binding protein